MAGAFEFTRSRFPGALELASDNCWWFWSHASGYRRLGSAHRPAASVWRLDVEPSGDSRRGSAHAGNFLAVGRRAVSSVRVSTLFTITRRHTDLLRRYRCPSSKVVGPCDDGSRRRGIWRDRHQSSPRENHQSRETTSHFVPRFPCERKAGRVRQVGQRIVTKARALGGGSAAPGGDDGGFAQGSSIRRRRVERLLGCAPVSRSRSSGKAQ
mmetsp:Transcript_5605/g.22019  ORF Transcript_5605/g.22019 Transcript_5605/m.22019 type:complete len:211 (-) Transcript_5605:2519-3151(-)